jgi:hypothetical protein
MPEEAVTQAKHSSFPPDVLPLMPHFEPGCKTSSAESKTITGQA